MRIHHFYPGPSRVYSKLPRYLKDAYHQGIMSCNHRSKMFHRLDRETKKVIKEKLSIPNDYEIVFVSSATECWEIIAQSLMYQKSHHIYNGSFGRKWADCTEKIGIKAVRQPLPIDGGLNYKNSSNLETICITHIETSNGTQVSNGLLKELDSYEGKITAIDATSSMGGMLLPWELGDVWFASVQKCFGLPAGLAVMVLSPKAIQRGEALGNSGHYNSLNTIYKNACKNETHHTPNVLNIYSLYRTQLDSAPISEINKVLENRLHRYSGIIEDHPELDWYIKDKDSRSKTVLCLSVKHPKQFLGKCEKAGFVLGKGYGNIKDLTIRIANFPAIEEEEVTDLCEFLLKDI